MSSSIVMTKDADGNIVLGKLEDRFTILEYRWDGPVYEEVTSTDTKSNTTSNEKSGRRGRVAGAAIGTVLMPGVGTVVGAAVGTGKKKKGNQSTTGNAVTTTKTVEGKSSATLKFNNLNTGDVITISIECNSAIDAELQNFDLPAGGMVAENIPDQKNAVQLLKEYKELLDLGIITEQEFQSKKAELLPLI